MAGAYPYLPIAISGQHSFTALSVLGNQGGVSNVLVLQGGSSVYGGNFNGGDVFTQVITFPSSGSYVTYWSGLLTGEVLTVTNKFGAVVVNFTTGGATIRYVVPETSIFGDNYMVQYNRPTSMVSNTNYNVFTLGINVLPTVSNAVQALTLLPGESYTNNGSTIVYQLNRTFTAGTTFSLFRYLAENAGTYQMTSSNAFVIPSDPSATSFIAGQNVTDSVTVVNSTATATPVTLTVNFPFTLVEQGRNVLGYIKGN
jgi:hypothetical protein